MPYITCQPCSNHSKYQIGQRTCEGELDRRDTLLDILEREVELRLIGDVPERRENFHHRVTERFRGQLVGREPAFEVLRAWLDVICTFIAAVNKCSEKLEVLATLDRDVDLLREAVFVLSKTIL